MLFPSSFAPLAFSLRVQFPEWSVQPLVAVPWGEPSSVCSHFFFFFFFFFFFYELGTQNGHNVPFLESASLYIAVQFPADSDVYF